MLQEISHSGKTTHIQTHKHNPQSTRYNTHVQTRQNLHPLVPNTVYLIQFINQLSVIHMKQSLRNLFVTWCFSPPISCFGKIFRKCKNTESF